MIKVFTSEDRFIVWQIKQLLEEKGIPCFIKNEFAIGAIGDLAPLDTWPEVWITDAEWLPKAQSFIQDFQETEPPFANWACNQCGEQNEGSFEICWQCGAECPDLAEG